MVLSGFVLTTGGAGEGRNSQQLELGAPLVFRAAPQNVALRKATKPELLGAAPRSAPALRRHRASSIFQHRVRKPAAKAAFRIDAEQKAAARGRGSEAQPRVLPRAHSPAGNLTLNPVISDQNIRGFKFRVQHPGSEQHEAVKLLARLTQHWGGRFYFPSLWM